MEKQIQTVYVKTNRISNFLLCWHDGTSKFIRESMLNKQEAYLYAPEEHAAAQQALSKAEDKGDNGWISVEDRLPEGFWAESEQDYYKRFSEQVNVLSSNGNVGTAAYDREEKDWFCNSISHASYFNTTGCHITHWQPLPPKP